MCPLKNTNRTRILIIFQFVQPWLVYCAVRQTLGDNVTSEEYENNNIKLGTTHTNGGGQHQNRRLGTLFTRTWSTFHTRKLTRKQDWQFVVTGV